MIQVTHLPILASQFIPHANPFPTTSSINSTHPVPFPSRSSPKLCEVGVGQPAHLPKHFEADPTCTTDDRKDAGGGDQACERRVEITILEIGHGVLFGDQPGVLRVLRVMLACLLAGKRRMPPSKGGVVATRAVPVRAIIAISSRMRACRYR